MAAKGIKGINIELGAETTGLEKALSDVNKKSREVQTELRGVDKLLKLDPSNTELVGQKQKLLAEAISNTREKLNRLKEAQAQVQAQFDKGEITEEQYRAFQREIVATEQKLKNLEAQAKRSWAEIGKSMEEAGDKMKSAGQTMTTHVTAPILAAGAAGVAMGSEIDLAFDKIRIGTGATGKALEGLKDDFRAVAKDVPDSFEDIATVIADLNTRLNLTGKPLQELSKQMLTLARLTGEDLMTLIPAITRLFGDWSVKTEHQSRVLDKLFRLSQSTGIEVGRLSELMTQFGSPLRQLGLEFDFAAAMFARFEKEGVNIETVLPGLKMALKNFAKAGREPAEALMETFTRIKEAGSAAEANKMAFEVFGARAGPDLAAAIRESRFDLDALIKQVGSGKETILGAAKDTDDWEESFRKLYNQIKIELEPALTKLFDSINKALPTIKKIASYIVGLVEAFTKLPPGVQTGILAFLGILAAIGPVLVIVGTLVSAIGKIITAFVAVKAAIAGAGGAMAILTGPVGITIAVIAGIIAAIVLLVTAIVLLVKYWDNLKVAITGVISKFTEMWNSASGLQTLFYNIKDALVMIGSFLITKFQEVAAILQPVFQKIAAFIVPILQDIVAAFQGVAAFIKPLLQDIANFIVEQFGVVITWFNENWPLIEQTILTVMNAIWAVIEPIIRAIVAVFQWAWPYIQIIISAAWEAIKSVTSAAWEIIKTVVSTAWDIIKTVISTALSVILDLIKLVMQVITGDWSGAWETLKNIGETILQAIISIVQTLLQGLVNIISQIWENIKSLTSTAWNAIKDFISGIWEAIRLIINSAISNVISSVQTFVDRAMSWGRNLIGNIISGIGEKAEGMLSAITSFLTNNIYTPIKDFVDRAASWGRNIIATLWEGIQEKADWFKKKIEDVLGWVAKLLPQHSPAEEGPFKNLRDWGANILTTIAEGLVSGKGYLYSRLKEILGFDPLAWAKPGAIDIRKALKTAWEMVDKPYIWGGWSFAGADCSGLVSLVLKEAGFGFGRMVANMIPKMLKEVSAASRSPIVVGWNPTPHVGIRVLDQWFEARGRKWGILGPGEARHSWDKYFSPLHRGAEIITKSGLFELAKGEAVTPASKNITSKTIYSPTYEFNFHGPVIADELGLKELENRLRKFRTQENVRRGYA